ncbi:MAG: hypothetical protein ACI4TZ_03885 [Christensenellales bacterium]
MEKQFESGLSPEQIEMVFTIEEQRNLLTYCENMELTKFVIAVCKDIYTYGSIFSIDNLQ